MCVAVSGVCCGIGCELRWWFRLWLWLCFVVLVVGWDVDQGCKVSTSVWRRVERGFDSIDPLALQFGSHARIFTPKQVEP